MTVPFWKPAMIAPPPAASARAFACPDVATVLHVDPPSVERTTPELVAAYTAPFAGSGQVM